MHDKGNFHVDIYMDVNGQWVSGDRDNHVSWKLHESLAEEKRKGLKSWQIKRETEQLLTEWNDRAEWGTLHFTAPSVSSM